MKEAIGTSLVFNLMMLFLGVFIVILVGSISYSKGFKIRNRIIDRIEENSGYIGSEAAIERDLQAIGYKIVSKSKCKPKTDTGGKLMSSTIDTYNYCVYQYESGRGYYYGVTVFISFDVPLIGNYINIPIYGETRVIYDKGTVKN